MGFCLVEFEEKGKQTVKHEFQVDGIHYESDPSYDVIINSNFMWNMGMKINLRDKILNWDGDKIPLKINGANQEKHVCLMLYIIHINLPLLKETEEQVEKILDSDYSKVDINQMFNDLDIHWDSKREL